MNRKTALESALFFEELVSLTQDFERFKEKYINNHELLDESDKQTLIVILQNKFASGHNDFPLEEIFKLVYEDENKAIFEARMFIASQTSGISYEQIEDILRYAQTDEEKLSVLARLLMHSLGRYDETKIEQVKKQIKEIKSS